MFLKGQSIWLCDSYGVSLKNLTASCRSEMKTFFYSYIIGHYLYMELHLSYPRIYSSFTFTYTFNCSLLHLSLKMMYASGSCLNQKSFLFGNNGQFLENVLYRDASVTAICSADFNGNLIQSLDFGSFLVCWNNEPFNIACIAWFRSSIVDVFQSIKFFPFLPCLERQVYAYAHYQFYSGFFPCRSTWAGVDSLWTYSALKLQIF